MIKGERKEYSKNKFVYVRRKADGVMLDMSEFDWFDNTTNKEEFEFLGYIDQQPTNPPAVFAAPDDTNMHACPLCGKTYKDENKLMQHKKKAHA